MSGDISDDDAVADAFAQEQAQAELGRQLAELAAQSDIPLGDDHPLTGRLAQVPPADQIPEHVYSAVAAVLAFLRDVENSPDG